MSGERPGIATISLTWREAPSAARASLQGVMDAALYAQLQGQGATGLAQIHTCARSMWIVSASHAAWAGALLQSLVTRRAAAEVLPTLRVGDDALRHVLRVAIGLDSFVQGEADIGGQVAEGFADAQSRGWLDGTLHLLRQSSVSLFEEGQENGFIRANRGLGALAVDALLREGATRAEAVGVVGAGAIGERVVAALGRAGWAPPVVYNRTPRPGTLPLASLSAHRAMVLCTSGPAGWFRAPAGVEVLVDLGLPGQCAGAAVGLDALLLGDPLRLSPDLLARAELAVERELGGLQGRLRSVRWQKSLSRLNSVRDRFLNEALDGAFAEAVGGLSEAEKRKVMAAAKGVIRQYSHSLLTTLKETFAEGEG